jgi:hypothetical protein
MSNDLDLSAGGVIDGTETIDEVGQRVFDRIVAVASGLQAKAEEHKHREFQFWAEQTGVALVRFSYLIHLELLPQRRQGAKKTCGIAAALCALRLCGRK